MLLISGLVLMAILAPSRVAVAGIDLDIHTLLYAASFVLLGFGLVSFSVFSKMFGIQAKLLPGDPVTKQFLRIATLERGVLLGLLIGIVGLVGSAFAVYSWGKGGFRDLDPREMMRLTIPSATAIALGA